MPIRWCCVLRNDVVLAENGAKTEGSIDKLSKTIIAKKPTAGWEFASSGNFKAVKLHVYETRQLVWSAACVHDHDPNAAKAFLEKLVLMTEPLRDTPSWRSGGPFAAQDEFGMMLQQRREQANSMGKLAMVENRVQEVKGIMSDNIRIMLENQEKAEAMEAKSESLMQQSKMFQKVRSSHARTYTLRQTRTTPLHSHLSATFQPPHLSRATHPLPPLIIHNSRPARILKSSTSGRMRNSGPRRARQSQRQQRP